MFTFHHSMQEKFDECMPKDEDEVITIQCVGTFWSTECTTRIG